LCLTRENIGAHDSFFDLGGNSISAMYISAMLNERFSADIPFQRIMELNDVASTAELVFRFAQSAGGLTP
jgi:acyl carrier protein